MHNCICTGKEESKGSLLSVRIDHRKVNEVHEVFHSLGLSMVRIEPRMTNIHGNNSTSWIAYFKMELNISGEVKNQIRDVLKKLIDTHVFDSQVVNPTIDGPNASIGIDQ